MSGVEAAACALAEALLAVDVSRAGWDVAEIRRVVEQSLGRQETLHAWMPSVWIKLMDREWRRRHLLCLRRCAL